MDLIPLPPFEFENWAVIALGGIPNKVQVGDMGVDGRIFPVGTKPTEGGLFVDDWFPIQVKQMDKVGRPDIDAFEAVMEREGHRPAAKVADNAGSSSPSAIPAMPTTNARRFIEERADSSSG